MKATSSISSIREHLEKYPDIEILGTFEIASKMDGIESSGFSNAEITGNAEKALEDFDGEGLIGEISDGIATSGIMSATILAANLLRQKKISKDEFRSVGKDISVGGIAAIVLEMIL